jgi:hypothetical protein
VVYACQIDDKSAYIYMLTVQKTIPAPFLSAIQHNSAVMASRTKKKEEPTLVSASTSGKRCPSLML